MSNRNLRVFKIRGGRVRYQDPVTGKVHPWEPLGEPERLKDILEGLDFLHGMDVAQWDVRPSRRTGDDGDDTEGQ